MEENKNEDIYLLRVRLATEDCFNGDKRSIAYWVKSDSDGNGVNVKPISQDEYEQITPYACDPYRGVLSTLKSLPKDPDNILSKELVGNYELEHGEIEGVEYVTPLILKLGTKTEVIIPKMYYFSFMTRLIKLSEFEIPKPRRTISRFLDGHYNYAL